MRKNTVSRFKYILTGLFLGCSLGVAAQKNNVVDEVVWVVGDEAIFKSDVEEYINSYKVRNMPLPANPYCTLSEELALRQLFLHQADLDSVAVNEDYIIMSANSELERLETDFGGRERLDLSLKEMTGKTYSQYRDYLRESLRENEKIREVQTKIRSKITATPADIRSFVKGLSEDSIPYVQTQMEVEVLIKEPEIALAEIERVKAELRDYTDRINGGMSFSSMAILYSEDEGTARKGGEVGFVPKGMLDPNFAAVAYSLQDPKKVSKIVESEFGYHIIQLIEKRGDKINCRHILRRPHVSDAEVQTTLLRMDSIANDIRKGRFTFEAAVTALSDDKDTRHSNGLMQNPETGTSRFQMDELPQEIAKVVDKMNISEISAPFLMKNDKNREVCVIVKVKNRIPAHRANVTEDFSLLQNMVLNMRGQDALQKWIRDKQQKTFVRINENWKNCEFKYPDWKF